MSPGLIISLFIFGLFLVWGVIVFVRRVTEKPTDGSSFHESGTGDYGGHGGHDGGGGDGGGGH